MRHAARTDKCQADIVKALRSVGVQVEYIKLPLDLLIAYGRGEPKETALMECKMPGEHLNKSQVEFIARWPGKVFVVHSPEEAVKQVIGSG